MMIWVVYLRNVVKGIIYGVGIFGFLFGFYELWDLIIMFLLRIRSIMLRILFIFILNGSVILEVIIFGYCLRMMRVNWYGFWLMWLIIFKMCGMLSIFRVLRWLFGVII